MHAILLQVITLKKLACGIAAALLGASAFAQNLEWSQHGGSLPIQPIPNFTSDGHPLNPSEVLDTVSLSGGQITLSSQVYNADFNRDGVGEGLLAVYTLSNGSRWSQPPYSGGVVDQVTFDIYKGLPLFWAQNVDNFQPAIVTSFTADSVVEFGLAVPVSYTFNYEGNSLGMYKLAPSNESTLMVFAPGAVTFAERLATIRMADGSFGTVKFAAPVPEPGLMLAAGAGLALFFARKRKV